jgi:hypothetical protein
MAKGMSDEIAVDGVTYVRVHYPCPIQFLGDPSGFLRRLNDKKCEELLRRNTARLIASGVFVRKDEHEKKHSVYEKGELFYEG